MNINRYIIAIYCMILISTTGKSLNMDKNHSSEIIITFEEEGKEFIDISNRFSIDFVHDGRIYRGQINGRKLFLPKFPDNIKYVNVVFNYDKYRMEFSNVAIKWLFLEQDMNWNFKVDFPPFDEENNENLCRNNLIMIYYFQFIPSDNSQVIEIYTPIYK